MCASASALPPLQLLPSALACPLPSPAHCPRLLSALALPWLLLLPLLQHARHGPRRRWWSDAWEDDSAGSGSGLDAFPDGGSAVPAFLAEEVTTVFCSDGSVVRLGQAPHPLQQAERRAARGRPPADALPLPGEQGLCIGSVFSVSATNGIEPARRINLLGFCFSTEQLFERVEQTVLARGGEVFETQRQLKRWVWAWGLGAGGWEACGVARSRMPLLPPPLHLVSHTPSLIPPPPPPLPCSAPPRPAPTHHNTPLQRPSRVLAHDGGHPAAVGRAPRVRAAGGGGEDGGRHHRARRAPVGHLLANARQCHMVCCCAEPASQPASHSLPFPRTQALALYLCRPLCTVYHHQQVPHLPLSWQNPHTLLQFIPRLFTYQPVAPLYPPPVPFG